MKNVVTDHRLENKSSVFPNLRIHWTRDEDELGYSGKITIWIDGNTKGCSAHDISLRQTMPLGMISITFDQCNSGCWAGGSFEGAGITERDLQWATAFAALALKDKHRRVYDINVTDICPKG